MARGRSAGAARTTVLGTLLAVFGCLEPFGPETDVALVVTSPSLALDSARSLVDVRILFVIRNDGEGEVAYERCANRLERLVADGEWVSVWAPFCAAIDTPPILIPEGSVKADSLRFATRLGEGFSERWRAPVDGTYRVRAGVLSARGPLELASDPFTVGRH